MANVNYEILLAKQKTSIKVFMILFLLLFLGTGFYSYVSWGKYSLIKNNLNTDIISNLQEDFNIEKSDFDNNKAGFGELNKIVSDKLSNIFPESDNYTVLTREIDSIEKQMDTLSDPFEIANIDFQTEKQEGEYSILPFRMNIRSSKKNFFKFLDLIENSGALTDDVRLMSLQSIRLNFEKSNDDTVSSGVITFTVQINSYFQKQSQ